MDGLTFAVKDQDPVEEGRCSCFGARLEELAAQGLLSLAHRCTTGFASGGSTHI